MNEIGIITTLKKALEFYGDSNNYKVREVGRFDVSNIQVDNGVMARNILEIIKEVENENNNYVVQFEQTQKEINSEEFLLDEIKNLKKTNDVLSTDQIDKSEP